MPVNDDPTLDAISDVNINEDAGEQTVNLTGIATGGSEVQQLRVTATSNNTGLIPDPTVTYSSADPTGTLAFTPVADQFGTATVTVTVEDGGLDNNLATPGDNATVVRTFTVNVAEVNDEPTLDALSDVNINEDAGEQTVNLTGIATGGSEVQQLKVTATSNNTGLIPDPTVTYSSADPTGTLTFTPAADQFGTATITVTVEDGGLDNNLETPGDNATTTQTFDVTVNPVNDEPTLDALSDININEDDDEQTVNLTGITAGVDETQPLSIVASSSDPALITASSVTISPAVSYGQLHQWAVSSGGNGHWYEWLEDTNSWDDAQAAAIARGGYLATPTSNEETHFLNNNLGVSVDTWIGGYQDLSDPTYSEPLGGWAWVTGEPWDYQNWYHADPNDGSGIEHQLVFRQADGMWGDENTATQRRALIEYDSDPRLIVEQSGQLLLSPQLNQFGTATITVTVEDGGLDNDLATPGDNATVDRTFTVNVAPVNDDPTLDALSDVNINEDDP